MATCGLARSRLRAMPVPAASRLRRRATAATGSVRRSRMRRNMLAPLAVVDAIEAAATRPFLEGVRREREIFFECLRSDQCKALVHAFFAERSVGKIPGVSKDTPTSTIDTVAIIGAGTMGAGIATACANAGLQVVLADVALEAVERGIAAIRR